MQSLNYSEVRRSPDQDPIQAVWTKGADWDHGTVQFKPKEILRVFAGQPDSNDRSHFTINYDLDGKPGIIDGRLNNDDTLTLRPRQGRTLYQNETGTEIIWDAKAPMTTQPGK